MVCITLQFHFTRLIPSTGLAGQPGLVVAKHSRLGLRTVSRVHYFSAEGRFLVPAPGPARNWMPEDFPFVEFLLLHQRDTSAPSLISHCIRILLSFRMLPMWHLFFPTAPHVLLTLDWRHF